MASKCIGSKYLHLSSLNRAYGSRSDFTVNLPSDLFNNLTETNYVKLNLQEITVNYSWYNVINDINNVFFVYDADTDSSEIINIPVGSYNVVEMRNFLNVALSGRFVVSYNATTNTYNFTATNPDNSISSESAGQFLGLEEDTLYSGTFSSARPIDMTYIKTLYLHSDIARINDTFDNLDNKIVAQSTILARIPITVAPFSNINYKNDMNCNEGIKLAVSQCDSIRFFITDERGNRINLASDYTLLLKFEIWSF